jgi:hypothetical protein
LALSRRVKSNKAVFSFSTCLAAALLDQNLKKTAQVVIHSRYFVSCFLRALVMSNAEANIEGNTQ